MKILSLIVPAYNSENFLDKCIPSFCDGTVLDALDIIIVNDGSTDTTAHVIHTAHSDFYIDAVNSMLG